MKYPVYSVRDVKVGFGQPQLSLNDGTMIRQFKVEVNEKVVYRYSDADYALFKIGEFETDSGLFTSCLPEFIVSASDLLERGDFCEK